MACETEQDQRYDCMGLPVTCDSDEALKWFNKSLAALSSRHESPMPMCTRACELDKSLVLAHCLVGTVWLSDLKEVKDPRVAPHIEGVKSVDTSKMTERERGHVRAFLTYASGNLPQAMEEWVTILVDYPHDILARCLHFVSCIMTGEYPAQRDTLARLLPHWDQSMQFYPFVLGEYAFSLEQNNQRDRAEEVARKALSMEPRIPWATHALGHVIEEERDPEEGVEFLTSTRKDWCDSVLGGHITWHLTLYYLDLGNTDTALNEFDAVLYGRATSDNVFGMLDAASLLWRLNVLGLDPGEKRWKKVTDSCTTMMENHGSAWFDTHIMMSLAHGKVSEAAARMTLAKQMIKSLADYSKSNVSTNCAIAEKLGVPVCNALLAFGQEKYDEVLSLILPLRYDLVRLGGSWAQRQVVTVTVIEAAVRAKKISLALALVAELKAQKPKSKRLSRLFEELKSSYDSQQRTLPPVESNGGEPAAKRTRAE